MAQCEALFHQLSINVSPDNRTPRPMASLRGEHNHIQPCASQSHLELPGLGMHLRRKRTSTPIKPSGTRLIPNLNFGDDTIEMRQSYTLRLMSSASNNSFILPPRNYRAATVRETASRRRIPRQPASMSLCLFQSSNQPPRRIPGNTSRSIHQTLGLSPNLITGGNETYL